MSARVAVALVLVASLAAGQGSRAALFDGRSLAGWDGDPRFWSVEDGAIVGRSTPEVPCERTTYLVRKDVAVRDFELRFAFQIEGGNSGLQFRSRVAGEWDVEGYQADIEDGESWTGCLYEQGGRGVVATRGERVTYASDGARSVERFGDARELLAHFRRGEWNECRVVAAGERIRIELNGFATCELIDRDPAHARAEGLLAVQLQAGPPMTVRLKDLRLREFGPEEAALVRERWSMSPSPRRPAVPQWIWAGANPGANEVAVFQRGFELRAAPAKAELVGSCDNRMQVFLNGRLVASGDDWASATRADVKSALVRGANLLAVRAENQGGPAGLQLELGIALEDGALERVITDARWLATSGAPEGFEREAAPADGAWRAATVFGPLGIAPWGVPAAPEDVELELELPPGFRAERVYDVPRESQGSWVSLCNDAAGGFYASAEDGPLFHVQPPPLDRPELGCAVERIDVELGDAQGLLWAFDSLYVVANGRQRTNGLYRVTDSDADGRLDAVRLLKALDGGGEHGPHAVLLGPDGVSLYVVGGNHTRLPEGVPSKAWDEDLLLPRHPDPGGHAVGVMAPGGWVCRTDPEGREWTLIAWGLRNSYDAAFDEEGELFTFDSDMEWDVGLPWYRPTRVLHLVQDGEYGWRNGSGKWPAHFPDSLPAVVDLGLGSPTGVCFGYGARFPADFERALFVADWAYGTIHAVHLEPRGASFGARTEVFARGKPLPVTDLVVGVDGALYFTVGGRGTRSALWRVVYEGEVVAEPPRAPTESERDASRARAQRILLESLRSNSDAAAIEILWPVLDSSDRFLRYAARTTLEGYLSGRSAAPEAGAMEAFGEPLGRALDEPGPRASVELTIALARAPGYTSSVLVNYLSLKAGRESGPRAVENLLALELETLDAETLLGALRALQLLYIRLGSPGDEERVLVADRLDALFPSGTSDVDRELARLLAYLQDPRAIPKMLRLIQHASTQEDAIHYAYALSHLRAGWTTDQRRAYFHWLDEIAPALRGGASFAKYLAAIRADAARGLEPAELEALSAGSDSMSATAIAAASDERAPALDLRGRPAHRWTVAEVEPHLGSVASGRSFTTGAAAYRAVICHTCHRLAGEGENTGPDLTGAGSRFTPRDLLEAILEPSRVVSDQYRDTEIVTTDDELIVGRIESELVLDGEPILRLRTQPPNEETLEIPLADVAERRPHALSRMPAGLVDQLSAEELFDLMAYVLSGADARAAAFAR